MSSRHSGVVADELIRKFGISDPALILTPGDPDSRPDTDGLLLASEIPSLRIAADWVILTGCNTAAPNGAPDAEGFSGLTRSFIQGGANGVLATHWVVRGETFAELTETLLDEYLRGNDGMGAAMQRTVSKWRQKTPQELPPPYKHPYFWAAYSAVGNLQLR